MYSRSRWAIALALTLAAGCSSGPARFAGEVHLDDGEAVESLADITGGYAAFLDNSDVYTSPDGHVWTKQPVASQQFKGLHVRYVKRTVFGLMAVVQERRRAAVFLSPDAKVWKRVDSDALALDDGDAVVALLEDSAGAIVVTSRHLLMRTADGLSWSRATDQLGVGPNDVVRTGCQAGDKRVVLLGDNRDQQLAWIETDQGVWQKAELEPQPGAAMTACAGGALGLVALGERRTKALGPLRPVVWSSADGKNWRAGAPPTAAENSTVHAAGATANGFVLAGVRAGHVAVWRGDANGWRVVGAGARATGRSSVVASVNGIVVAFSDQGHAAAARIGPLE